MYSIYNEIFFLTFFLIVKRIQSYFLGLISNTLSIFKYFQHELNHCISKPSSIDFLTIKINNMNKIRLSSLLSKFLGMTVINLLFLLFIRFKGIDTIAFSSYVCMIFSWGFLVEFKCRQLENSLVDF